jgi:hypothetical protein
MKNSLVYTIFFGISHYYQNTLPKTNGPSRDRHEREDEHNTCFMLNEETIFDIGPSKFAKCDDEEACYTGHAGFDCLDAKITVYQPQVFR